MRGVFDSVDGVIRGRGGGHGRVVGDDVGQPVVASAEDQCKPAEPITPAGAAEGTEKMVRQVSLLTQTGLLVE